MKKYVITIITIVTLIKLYNQCKDTSVSYSVFSITSPNDVEIFFVILGKVFAKLGKISVNLGKTCVKSSLSAVVKIYLMTLI